jgi:hypothetical protein
LLREGVGTHLTVAALALLAVLILLAFEIKAIFNHYELRVTADTPTFLALIRDLAIHPLRPDSVFFGSASSDSIHASPYLQLLALIWKFTAPTGQLTNAMAIGEFAAIVTIPMTLFVLLMLWCFGRQLGGPLAAWASVLALLAVFGPVDVIFSGDLSFNGFLDTGYFPTTFAIGLTLGTLMALRRRTIWAATATVLLASLTVTSDPFNGAVLIALMTLQACIVVAADRREAMRVVLLIVAAFLVADAWPASSVFSAFANEGLPVPFVVLGAALVPTCWWIIGPGLRKWTPWIRRHVFERDISARGELAVAEIGAWATVIIAVWGLYALGHWPAGVPILQANRLGFYWNDQRDRWLLLLLPGMAGLIAMLRLAQRRHEPFLLTWFAALFAAGLLGAVVHLATGYQLPLYYRFILLCQVPLAISVGVFVAEHKSRRAMVIVLATLVGAFTYKAVTLLVVPGNQNYFGSSLSTLWQFNRVIPPRSGVVASDPNTSYFIPVITDNHVLTLGMGHADSGTELRQARAGYKQIHELYVGSQSQAAAVLRRMWSKGVRWVVVETYTTLARPNQKSLYATPYNGLITAPDINLMARYNSRLASVGAVTFQNNEFTVYRLQRRRLMSVTDHRRTMPALDRETVLSGLRALAKGGGVTAVREGRVLYRLGVRMVTLSYGELGSTPTLTAYGRWMRDDQMVQYAVRSGRWALNCLPECYVAYSSSETERLGRVLYTDGRFSTVVALSAPTSRRLAALVTLRHHRQRRSHRVVVRRHHRSRK